MPHQLADLPLPSVTRAVLGVAGAFIAIELFRIGRWFFSIYRTPLRTLNGPREGASFAPGNILKLFRSERSVLDVEWVARFGPTFAIPAFFGSFTLYTQDPRALTHVFNHTDVYWKPEQLRFGLKALLGPGILVSEGQDHKNQRRILNPAFGPAQLRQMHDIFLDTAAQMRDIWLSKLASSNGKIELDVMSWLSRATLDIIGLAGFNYPINSLNENDGGPPNPLADNFDTLFRKGKPDVILMTLHYLYPFLRPFKTARQRAGAKAHKAMMAIGRQLVNEKKAAIERGEKEGRDLLTLLLRYNMSSDIPADQRLTDEEVVAQVPTFLAAGHETTSTSLTWALFALAQKPAFQAQLRSELNSLSDTPAPEALGALPLLDAVVRETLRLHAVVAHTDRIAVKSDVLPLSEPVTDLKGNVHSHLRINKGDVIFVPILALNRSKAIWGEDAMEFNPERWREGTPKHVPGVMPGLLSFLHGERSCIGWRFAVLEMKVVLFHLVRTFKFELVVPAEKVTHLSATISRPMIEGEDQVRMPLYVSVAEDV